MIITIYNRTGQKVWVSKRGYTEPWDGGNLPIDTYYYFIQLNDGSGIIRHGIVTIVR